MSFREDEREEERERGKRVGEKTHLVHLFLSIFASMDHALVSRMPLFVRTRIALRNKTCTFEYLLLLVPTMDRINPIKFLLYENPSL